jgi:hypothetical protein
MTAMISQSKEVATLLWKQRYVRKAALHLLPTIAFYQGMVTHISGF